MRRGSVEERPWGATLGAIAARRLTGQVTVADRATCYCIAFADGHVIAATSSHPDDATLGLAIGAGIVPAGLARELTVMIATQRDRSDVDIIARHIGLDDTAALLLRRRMVAHRATRSFALSNGRFTFDDHMSIPISPCCELDTRAVVYRGARHHLVGDRLLSELARFGSHFALRKEALDSLAQFGFGYREAPLVDKLLAGVALRELEHARELDQRSVYAIVYALTACGACDARSDGVVAPPPPRPRPPPVPSDGFAEGTVRGSPLATSQPLSGMGRRKLIAELERRITAGADYFALLGLPFAAPRADVRNAYLELAKQLHPDLGMRNEHALRVFVEVGKAFSILTDVARRAAYFATIGRDDGGDAVPETLDADADSKPAVPRTITAEERFRRAERAMGSGAYRVAIDELETALQLDAEHATARAMLAWARFCEAPNKADVAARTREILKQAATAAGDPLPLFYLGRVERILANNAEALGYFRRVLAVDPNHAEAKREVRVLERRVK
ncbi:MAG TPA: DnaJ domain-containing protein [Kofleriaceae bacterium]